MLRVMRTAPALLLLCSLAAAQAPLKFMGYPVTVVDPGTDETGFHPKGAATVCVEAKPRRQCYTPREPFGRSPKAEVVEFKAGAQNRTVPADAVNSEEMILDVGPGAVAEVERKLDGCRTLLWNGPMGAFEVEPFDRGTNGVARAVARLTQEGKLRSVAGGGDTVAALAHAGVLEQFSYVSTAGGAFLEWLEGKELPGVAALAPR